MSRRKRCFVIMPFSKTTEKHTEEYWANHYDNYLKPLIEESTDLEAFRSEALRGDVLRQIITDLVVSPVVVADLTDANPNVYWELGIRQSFKHGTITIAEEGTERPFDLSIKGILYYSDDRIKNEEFRKTFKKALQDCLEHPESPDSHVLETLTGRGTLFEIFRKDETIRRMEALVLECEWNNTVFNEIYDQIDKNVKTRAEGGIGATVTSRLSSSAMELLLTTRYLEEDTAFYYTVRNCCTSIDTINDMLRRWPSNGERVEKWFLESKELYLKRFVEHKKVLTDAQKKLIEKSY